MINYDELAGSVLTLSQLKKRLFDSSKGTIVNYDFTYILNKILKESEQSADEAYIRFSFMNGKLYDSLKLKILARSKNVIVVYSKSCTIEFDWQFIIKPEYKYKFKTEDDAIKWMVTNHVYKGRYFIHSKTGRIYKLLNEGFNSEDLGECVVYKAMYGNGQVWIRPKSMFFENVEINGELVPRFKEIKSN